MQRSTIPVPVLSLAVLLLGAAGAAAEEAGSAGSPADTVSITQVDASSLLLDQTVDVYVGVADETGRTVEGLRQDDFRVLESTDAETFVEVPRITAFDPEINREQGIRFLLLLDNSGSMYDTLGGRTTDDPASMRISGARSAVVRFLESVDNRRDTVGLATFNTMFSLHAERITDVREGEDLLESIERPGAENAYTELYGSLLLASRSLETREGRNVVIVLSDGENFPLYRQAGREHPVFGDETVGYQEPIETFQREGITLFAVNFGSDRERDRNLHRIALRTGGMVFDARNAEELADVYGRIRDRVLGEYRISYRAPMDPAEKKHVRVELASAGGTLSDEHVYFSAPLFGLPMERLTPWLAVPLVLGVLLFWFLSLIRFERRRSRAGLDLLHRGPGTIVSRATVALDGPRTVIGSSDAADLTVAGSPGVRERHATIVRDAERGRYTLVSDDPVAVNNRPVRKKDLEPGDVIDVGGTLVVFDDAETPDEG